MKKKRPLFVSILWHMIVFVVMVAFSAPDLWAQVLAYPKQGQSSHQQKKDQEECEAWASKQTGYKAETESSDRDSSLVHHDRKPVRNAARGAARGAVIGEIADGDAGKAAVAGVVTGGVRHGLKNHREDRREDSSEHNLEKAPRKESHEDYLRAYKTCLEGKGYTVSTQ